MNTLRLIVAAAVACTAAACLPTTPYPGYDPCWNSAPGCAATDGSAAVDVAFDSPPARAPDLVMPDFAVPDLLMPDLLMPDLRPMCVTSTDCSDDTKPICDVVSQTCRVCGTPGDDTACATRNAKTPRCDTMTHVCVQCLANTDCPTPTTPICDTPTNACRACAQNSECPSLVCNDDGSCEPAGAVVYVDNKNGTCNGGNHAGTMADPYCDTTDALKINGVSIIYVVGEITVYKPVSITNAITVRIVGPGATAMPTAKIAGMGGQAVNLSVNNGTTSITFDGMELRGDANNNSDAVDCSQSGGSTTLTIRRSLVDNAKQVGVSSSRCTLNVNASTVQMNGGIGIMTSGGTATIMQSTVTGNIGIGVTTSGGIATITQSTITGNTAGGISLSGGTTYQLQNNFIFGNPGTGVSVDTTSIGTFDFNTVVRNGAVGTNGGFECGAVSVPIQSSIIWGNANDGMTQFFGKCTLTNVVTGTDSIANANPKNPDFVSLMAGMIDVHLVKNDAGNMACCVDKVTQPDGGALTNVDHDGNHRPQGNGWDIGAHEVQ